MDTFFFLKIDIDFICTQTLKYFNIEIIINCTIILNAFFIPLIQNDALFYCR